MNRDTMKRRRIGSLVMAERVPVQFKNEHGYEAWFYVGRGHFFFYSTFDDTTQKCIRVPTKSIRSALARMDGQLLVKRTYGNRFEKKRGA